MPVVTVTLLGRFGNQVMQYLFARAYAEKHGFKFQCDRWIGQRIFDLPVHPVTKHALSQRSELDLVDGEGDINLRGYAQHQVAMIYTKQQAQAWLRFPEPLATILQRKIPIGDELVGHRRVGDYIGYGYPQVSLKSYFDACDRHGLDAAKLQMVTEETPLPCYDLPAEMDFLPDFFRLMRAPVLLRGNSTFSWVAGLLGNGRVFSPVIDGLAGGQEYDVEFIEGNHKKFTNLPFVTDLILP